MRKADADGGEQGKGRAGKERATRCCDGTGLTVTVREKDGGEISARKGKDKG